MSVLRFPPIMWLSEAECSEKRGRALVYSGNAFHLGIDRNRLRRFIKEY
jgi:hypothetical protein